ncbi:unnamed protein product [Pleuronectes platessa]|uniref:Uncharacterized protein n=1 Tax=Pleuronectes platessa TaxID=8262 RepID=A0A9N7VBM6_PLEPL|nr:unnamed protein product [Pleuronectes platessa]
MLASSAATSNGSATANFSNGHYHLGIRGFVVHSCHSLQTGPDVLIGSTSLRVAVKSWSATDNVLRGPSLRLVRTAHIVLRRNIAKLSTAQVNLMDACVLLKITGVPGEEHGGVFVLSLLAPRPSLEFERSLVCLRKTQKERKGKGKRAQPKWVGVGRDTAAWRFKMPPRLLFSERSRDMIQSPDNRMPRRGTTTILGTAAAAHQTQDVPSEDGTEPLLIAH